MFFHDGYICPICTEKFKETDDIVVCPDCGAPHHRACWSSQGKCSFSADHGTPGQWRRTGQSEYAQSKANPEQPHVPEKNVCPRCGHDNPSFSEFCSKCGMILSRTNWNSAPPKAPPPHSGGFGSGSYGEFSPIRTPIIDPYGGLQKNEIIADVTVEEIAACVGVNSAYYLPRFHKMSANGDRLSWNWAAFFLAPYWLLYRKNHVIGWIVMIVNTILNVVNSYIANVYLSPVFDAKTYAEMEAVIEKSNLYPYMIMVMLLFLTTLIVSVIFALAGNYICYRTCLRRIKETRAKHGLPASGDLPEPHHSSEYLHELSCEGGISTTLVIIAFGLSTLATMLVNAAMMSAGG